MKVTELFEVDLPETNRAWLGLGSNLGNHKSQINKALALLEGSTSIKVLRTSSLYLTKPWGFTNQPDFLNAVTEIEVTRDAESLLLELQQMERDLGRLAGSRRWGPRVIDLDLLLYGEQILFRPDLIVPHPRMHQRAFVLQPLFELEPDLMIPSRGTVRKCLNRLKESSGIGSCVQLYQKDI